MTRTLWLLLAIPALAEIGDPCPDGECTPGLVCSTDEDGTMYCTGRCPAEGCPDGLFCRETMGVRICERGLPPTPVGFGEACGEDPCEEGLFCALDGEEQYCSRPCNGPGSCPQGWSCTRGNMLCKRRDGAAGFGDLCGDEPEPCAEGLTCAAFPELGEICTQSCAGGEPCGGDFVCDGEVCEPAERTASGIGGPCAPGATDEDCTDGLYCYVSNAEAYCTGSCSAAGECPEGYGCVELEALEGECRRGVADDEVFGEGEVVDPGNIEDPPPPAPTVDMGVAATADEGESCACDATGGGWFALLLIAGRRRRRGGPG